ncbi:MAG TPA: ORF6N domain-containing protein [Burkholderiales bacterium]|nr:ORF6N domain-containing protein [Burkholderiales bacterium]
MRPVERIADRIHTIRGQRVMVDADLALLYGVTTRQLNQQVKRNSARFPADLAFRLRAAEKKQVVTNCDHLRRLKYSPAMPLVFTEHGALMAASVLNSPRAVEVGLFVVRAFVRMREVIASHREFAKRLHELERKIGSHDRSIGHILGALRRLTAPPEPLKRRRIGFL